MNFVFLHTFYCHVYHRGLRGQATMAKEREIFVDELPKQETVDSKR